MRRLLISTAMIAALGTAAMAQSSAVQPNPNGAMPPATTTSPDTMTSPPTTNDQTAPGAVNSPGAMSASPDSHAGPMGNQSLGDTTGALNANNAASNTTATTPQPGASADAASAQAGGDYPVCRTRAQDHCRVARNGYSHHHATHGMASKAKTGDSSGAAATGANPGA